MFVFTIGSALTGSAQTPPLKIFKNYFVTGDYVVAGWVENSSANGLASGTISVPDCRQAQYMGIACLPSPIPVGADIVSAYLYWGTVEGSQSSFAGQQAFFNGYKIVGDVLGNPNAPTSWSSGGCTGSSGGSKTMRFYRADVRPYLPLDLNSSSPTFGALVVNASVSGPITVKMADSGSNGNTQPNALGATLVVIYRVLAPHLPLNAVVLYDGSYAPSNGQPTMTQDLGGFYEPGIPTGNNNPNAKLTHIVANGQINKGENVYFGSNPQNLNPLLSLYTSTLGANAPPFPGIYGAWDNPTWNVGTFVNGSLNGFDPLETTSVTPASTNSGCVNWGAIVFSTTVQDTDGDGLLDSWENNHGYTDEVSGNHIDLPLADPLKKDLFVETDYLALRDANNSILHSHLPKQAALDAVGDAFAAPSQGISVHFDLPSGIYSGDHYVVSTGHGGNEISESALVCTDPVQPAPGQLCAFPGQPAVSWKGGLLALQNGALAFQNNVGAFQAGRAQSYRYALFGHSMGEPKSYWSTVGSAYAVNDAPDLGSSMPQLVNIVVSNNTATVKIKSPSLINGVQPLNPPLVVKPGDCSPPPPSSPPLACLDDNNNLVASYNRVTIAGALLPGPFTPGTTPPISPLNGTYFFNTACLGCGSGNADPTTGMITTTFQITTANVPNGTYDFSNEPQLGVSYLGPTSSSGHGDFGGGGDLEVTLGLWGADNAPNCQPDPSQTLGVNQVYCDDQVGTLKVQTGTLMHELGHTLTLAHGGAYYNPANPSVPTYDLNCKPNFLSVMNYLFQVRGFVDGGFDYSAQTLPALNETTSTVNGVFPLSESSGVGYDNSNTAAHLTRWYSRPNGGDTTLQDLALGHCDGSPLASTENPNTDPWVRVEGTVWPGGNFSAPFDWNNNLTVPDNNIAAPGLDLNHNGIIGDAPFAGFTDWDAIDFQQMNARSSGFGFSEGGGLQKSPGGGLQKSPGGGTDQDGGGLQKSPGGGLQKSPGGGLQKSPGGGLEHNADTANFTVDPPSGLNCLQSLTTTTGTIIPACTGTGPFLEKSKSVPLNWTSPDFGQIRSYTVWRALGSFTTVQQVMANISQFSKLSPTLTGTPPSTSFIDSANLKSTKTYTYFVTDSNKPGAKSAASTPLVVTMK
jgi:hypothetical protein